MTLNKTRKKEMQEMMVKVVEEICLLNSQEEAEERIETLQKKQTSVIISFVNAHAINICCDDIEFCNALLKSDIMFRDGVGMQILYKSIGKKPGANLNGSDLIPRIIEKLKGKQIALFGSISPYSLKAAKRLTDEGHKIILAEPGFNTEEYYLNLLNNAKPEVVILGMGMPKQEKLSILITKCVDNRCLIINGGAIIDLWGQKVRRAPFWIRKIKVEWLFRLFLEPRRLFKRYVIGNYIFLRRIKTVKNILHSR
jgi:exopolysaccharide biosynthesis WecB/TagA/CpsF family protein